MDALPPTVFGLGRLGWAPTIELTFLVRGLPAYGWLSVHVRGRLVQDVWFDEEAEVYDSAGRLLAQSCQLAQVGAEPRATTQAAPPYRSRSTNVNWPAAGAIGGAGFQAGSRRGSWVQTEDCTLLLGGRLRQLHSQPSPGRTPQVLGQARRPLNRLIPPPVVPRHALPPLIDPAEGLELDQVEPTQRPSGDARGSRGPT